MRVILGRIANSWLRSCVDLSTQLARQLVPAGGLLLVCLAAVPTHAQAEYPYTAAVNPATNTVYIVYNGTGNVLALNGSTGFGPLIPVFWAGNLRAGQEQTAPLRG